MHTHAQDGVSFQTTPQLRKITIPAKFRPTNEEIFQLVNLFFSYFSRCHRTVSAVVNQKVEHKLAARKMNRVKGKSVSQCLEKVLISKLVKKEIYSIEVCTDLRLSGNVGSANFYDESHHMRS